MIRLYPRHGIDIGWRDLVSVLMPLHGSNAPDSPGTKIERRVAAAGPGQRSAVISLSVRTAFDALLRAMRLAPGDEIVMSAVNIAAMADIAIAHGLTIRPVDIDPSSLAPDPSAVAAAVGERTRMILIAHLFGARISMAPFAGLGGPKCLLVEDCAQAWTPGWWGSPQADVSLFSFGPIKTATALGGALAMFHDHRLADRVRGVVTTYPTPGESWFVRRALKYALLKGLSTPTIYATLAALLRLANRDVDAAVANMTRSFGPTTDLTALRRRPPGRMIRLLARRLDTYAGTDARYQSAMALFALMPTVRRPGAAVATHSHWVIPVLMTAPDATRTRMAKLGFDATRGATSLRAIAASDANVPMAARMLTDILYLPSPARMPAPARQLMASAIVQAEIDGEFQ